MNSYLKFTDDFEKLKNILQEGKGSWEESGDNKKAYRLNNRIMNWFPSTGTVQFQGKEPGKNHLEIWVNSLLSPDKDTTPKITPPLAIETA